MVLATKGTESLPTSKVEASNPVDFGACARS